MCGTFKSLTSLDRVKIGQFGDVDNKCGGSGVSKISKLGVPINGSGWNKSKIWYSLQGLSGFLITRQFARCLVKFFLCPIT